MPMQNPPHPGEILKYECLEPLALTVERAAEGLEISPETLHDLVNEKVGVSVDIAIRLSQAFGSTPETWLRLQMAYDLWQARELAAQIQVENFAASMP